MAWRRTLIPLTILSVFCAAALFLFHGVGRWLMVQDPLQHARAIAVLGGQVPFRAMEAAAIYKQGWAPEVWVTRSIAHPEDLALARLGIDRPYEDFYSQQVLVRLGVPAASVRLLPKPSGDTVEDLTAIAAALQSAAGARVILVTSKYHARRVRLIWRAVTGNRLAAIVRYAPDDPFQPDRWWRDTTDAQAVAHECMGILNVWAGFPLKAGR